MLENADYSHPGLRSLREAVLPRMVKTHGSAAPARAGKTAEGSIA